MKKIITPIVALVALGMNAQSFLDDAIDLSSEKMEGTARYRAMGGSMGALGSDISAVQLLNPAGGAVSVRSHGSITFGVSDYENETSSTAKMSNDETNFNMTQFGGSFVFENQNMNSGWRRFALTASYNRNNDLDRQINVAPYSTDFVYQDGYYFEETDGTVNRYTGDFLYDGERVSIDGYNDQFSIGFSTNYNNQIYLGAGMNFHNSQKEAVQDIYRSNQSEGATNDTYQDYYQDGTGFSLNLGVIAKVTDELRLGVAYHSPTWWNIQETSRYGETLNGTTFRDGPFYQEYDVRTPSKLVASGALVLGKSLAINADAIFKDYSNIDFDGMAGGQEATVNQNVNSELQDTWEFRVGTEYRIEDFRIRGGYRYTQDPYKDLDGNASTYSFGLGYNFGNVFLDGAYDYTDGNTAFRTASGATGTYVDQDLDRSNFTVTLGYKF
ncbi:hypothetical protein UJ101_01366 [Flavobacteriaceae bacterium UJ101]|nr:hypothetical protein UJ101_01366 [Flavobacteriaceae bacterium UJ101]